MIPEKIQVVSKETCIEKPKSINSKKSIGTAMIGVQVKNVYLLRTA